MKSGFRMVTLLAALALLVAVVPVQAEVSAPPGPEVRFTAPQASAPSPLPMVLAGGVLATVAVGAEAVTRAKFKVQEITRRPGWNGIKEVQEIKLSPVMDGSEENRRFYAASPGGSISLATVNAEVVKQFDLGQEFYVDFTPANQAPE